MTDEQIIKAFEVYYEQDNDMLLTKEVKKAILDLIKRQQAEIEHFRDLTKKIKSEAIKEVTAELYNSFAQYETYDRHHTFEILDKIQSVEDFLFDNLVKELKEGK